MNLYIIGCVANTSAEEVASPETTPSSAVTPAAPDPTGTAASSGPPTITAVPLAPAVIRLQLKGVGQQRPDHFVVEQQGPQIKAPSVHVWANCGVPSNAPPPFHCTGTQLVSTAPDAVYHFRAAIAAAGAVQSPWTADVEVHTPSEPDLPPAAPKQLGATARSAFVIQLSWEDASDNEYGFEVQCRSAQSSSFEEVALRNPNEATFVHQGRAPETEYVYRVRAFNPHGWSEFSNEVTVRTPDVAPNAIVPSATPSVPAPCTTLDAVSVQPGRVDWRDGIASFSIVCHGIELGGGHTVDAVSSGCGAQNCSWAVYGVYDGCYRLLGDDLSGVGPCPRFGIVATPRSGWPVISEGRHFSAFESDVELYAFLNGRYVWVDSYGWTHPPRCADPHGFYNQDCEPKDFIPPFLEDQFD